MPKKVVFNWSGGKDSSLALYHLLNNPDYQVETLLTSISTEHDRISMHGVRRKLLLQQAEAIGIPLQELLLPESSGMTEYNQIMRDALLALKEKGITHCAFGDIFLEDLKKYREERLAEIGMQALFPIWKRDTKELANEFMQLGFKTALVCIKANQLNQSFAGREYNKALLADLPSDVDPCGENGEFHTFCYDGPIFKNAIKFSLGERIYKEYQAPKSKEDSCVPADRQVEMSGYYFQDLIPEE